ncbi:MAG TPA: hypothetical protein VNU70_02090 [Puia sp.]|nr:hypothetical protein [Puia sp.]
METSATTGGGVLQLILLGAFLVIAILFLMTEQSTLRTIRTENRTLQPGLVWLQLIPLFGQVWQFIVVTRIADSIRKEIASWDNDSILGAEALAIEDGNKRPGYGIGIAYCTLNVISILLNYLLSRSSPVITGVIGLGATVCWVSYWVTLSGYKKKLRQKNLATL